MSEQKEEKKQAQIKRLSFWIRLLTVLFRTLIILGLISSAVVILLLALTSRFSCWILFVPGLLIALGILLAWVEYKLHNRHYQMAVKISGEEGEGSNKMNGQVH